MSRRTVGLLAEGNIPDCELAAEAARKRLEPWHIDACHHDGQRGVTCACPFWAFDRTPVPQAFMPADHAGTEEEAGLLRLDGLQSWVNLHDEWYDRWDCTGFDTVVRADIGRVYGKYTHLVVVCQIHYF